MGSFSEKMFRDRWVGAFAPSSRYVRRRVLSSLGSGYRRIVEYGPGDGSITRSLVSRLAPAGALFAVERNSSFAAELRASIADSRVSVVRGDALQFAAADAAAGVRSDVVVSSIPLSFFSISDREAFVRSIRASLSQDGVCIVFHQYSLLALPLLRRYFQGVSWQFELRNLFPCFVIIARV